MKIVSAWILVLADAGAIFFFSSLSHPVPHISAIEKYHIDFIFHTVEYGLFGFLILRALRLTWPKTPVTALWFAAIILGMVYGLSDEWHQSFTPLRDPSLIDLVADTLGTTLGSLLYARNKSF